MSRGGIWLMAALAATAVLYSAAHPRAQTVLSQEDVAKSLLIEKLEVAPASVSGVVLNKTPHMVRNVEVLIQYHWLWNNEYKPGGDPPGELAIIRIAELPPGQSSPFRHTTSAGADRKDGRFAPEVTIGGFTVVVPAR